jgi:dihydrofolate reductase
MRGMIAALNPDRIIGTDGRIPWHHSADLKRFKQLTLGGTVIMGRKTFESVGRPLPGRTNVVVSRTLPSRKDLLVVPTVEAAIAAAVGDVWFIGGRRIYEAAMPHADVIDLTWVPDVVDHPAPVRFPDIHPRFRPGPVLPFPGAPALRLQRWTADPTTS